MERTVIWPPFSKVVIRSAPKSMRPITIRTRLKKRNVAYIFEGTPARAIGRSESYARDGAPHKNGDQRLTKAAKKFAFLLSLFCRKRTKARPSLREIRQPERVRRAGTASPAGRRRYRHRCRPWRGPASATTSFPRRRREPR